MVVGAKVCELTDGFLWFVCGLYVGILMSPLTSLAQAVTSQAETRELLKRVFIVIIPQYLFEFNGFRMNLVNLFQKNYSINDRLGF